MPRRANDPDLLRAQAQGGRDGENAYRVSQEQLRAQRQGAVQQAMQEAALRGAPAGAISQLRGQVAAPYNQAIRSTTQAAGDFSADMSARQGRLYDFNQAVLAARQLIPTQIQQAVAPIRAENRFRLQSIRTEGENRVNEIEAQTALQLAQMQASERLRAMEEAERRRKEREEAAKLPTVTQSELAASLEGGAADILSQAQAQAQGTVAQHQQAMNADPKVQSTLEDALAAREAARWGYASTTGEAARRAMSGEGPYQAPTATAPPSNRAQIAAGHGVAAPVGTPATFPQEQAPTPTAEQARLLAGIGGLPEYNTPPTPPPRPTQTVDDLSAEFDRLANIHQQAEAPYFSTDTGYLTLPDLQRLGRRFGDSAGPLAQFAMTNPINTQREIAEVVGGQPMISPYGVAAQQRPEAQESFRQAMELSAARLSKNYAVDMPGVQLAMAANRGSTLADVLAAQQGLPPISEQTETLAASQRDAAEQAQSDAEKAYKEQDTATRRAETDARQQASDDAKAAGEVRRQTDQAAVDAIFNQAGISYTKSLGPLEAIYNIVVKNPTAFNRAVNQVEAWLNENEGDYDIQRAMSEEGIVDPTVRRLIEARFG